MLKKKSKDLPKKKCWNCPRSVGSVKPNASQTCGDPECVKKRGLHTSKIWKQEMREAGII